MSTPLILSTPHHNRLWQAIHYIPDTVLTDYLADEIIDAHEIDDITRRLEHICRQHDPQLEVSEADHALIRSMVRQAVELISQRAEAGEAVTGQLCAHTLADVRSAMGELLQSGQIALKVEDPCYADTPHHGDAIPEDRPEDYDETQPNEL